MGGLSAYLANCQVERSRNISSCFPAAPEAKIARDSRVSLSRNLAQNDRSKMATKQSKPEYSPGLAGVIAGETEICWVDPDAGLAYRGYDIHEMAEQASFEEVAYLLLNGELPTAEQLARFTRDIAAERALPGPVTEMLRLLPSNSHPMDIVRTGVSMLGTFDRVLNDNSHDVNIRKAMRLIASVSMLIADGWRIVHDEKPLTEKPELTLA